MEEVIRFLKERGPVPAGMQTHLRDVLSYFHYQPGACLLKTDQVADRIWFLKTGIAKWQVIIANRAVITWLSIPDSIVYPSQSFNAQTRARESVIAVNACEGWILTRQALYDLYREFPETIVLERTIKDELQEMIKEHSLMKSNPSLQQRFSYLTRNFRDVLYQVRDADLASFLGMSERSFRKLKNTRR